MENALNHGDPASHVFFYMIVGAPDDSSEFPVLIPHTVLHSYGKPVAWFHADPNQREGTIVMRSKSDLSTAVIAEELWRLGSSSATATAAAASQHHAAWQHAPKACFVQCSGTSTSLSHVITAPRSPSQAALVQFVQTPRDDGGLLQAYVKDRPETDGTVRNSVVFCSYTPTSFFAERLISAHTTMDSRVPPEYRLALEVPSLPGSKPKRQPVVSASVAVRFFELCAAVAGRAKRAHGYSVLEMTIACRIDCNDRIVIMWCESLLLRNVRSGVEYACFPDRSGVRATVKRPPRAAGVTKGPSAPLPHDHNLVAPLFASTKQGRSTTETCPVCKSEGQAGHMPRVQKRYLLLCLSLLDRNVQKWPTRVPPSVALLHPSISHEEFLILQADPSWLDEFLFVCGSCVTRCNVALEQLTVQKISAAPWLGIDDRHRYGHNSRSMAGQADSGHVGSSAALRVHALLLDCATTSSQAAKDVEPDELAPAPAVGGPGASGSRRQAMSKKARNRRDLALSDGNTLAKGGVEQASRVDPDAADLYSTATGVWRKVGFGRPQRNPRCPRVVTSSLTLENAQLVAALKERLAVIPEDEAKRRVQRPAPSLDDAGQCPPCQTPIDVPSPAD